jgi:hypothetical protein
MILDMFTKSIHPARLALYYYSYLYVRHWRRLNATICATTFLSYDQRDDFSLKRLIERHAVTLAVTLRVLTLYLLLAVHVQARKG